MAVTKLDIVKLIVSETGKTQFEIKDIVQRFLDNVVETLADGKKLEFRKFGVFELVVAKEKKGRNPKKPQNEVIIPEHIKVRFRSSEELVKRVLQLDTNDFK